MTLLERFIEVNGWSTSRKTVLLMGITLPAHLLGWAVLYAANVDPRVVDLVIVHRVVAFGAVVLVVCLMAGASMALAGREGRWTGYLVALLYGAYVIIVIQTAGNWSTPFFAWYPIGVITLTLWFDERIGIFTFLLGLFWLGLIGALQWGGVLPYAPAIIDRTMDSQQTVSWAGGVLAPILLFFAFCFLLSLLVLASRRLQNDQLREAREKVERSARVIGRYVPSQVAERILSGEHDEDFRPVRTRLTVFFSDLEGFTTIAEELDPESLEKMLNEYFSEMTRIADQQGGTVDELSGDAILVFFGAPTATTDKDHALRAARMALEMQRAVEALNRRWSRSGIDASFRVRMGINTGVVTVGTFGSSGRMKYGVLGRHVNLAARLQSTCEPGQVLLSHATWLLIRDEMECRPRGEAVLKGIARPVKLYELGEPQPRSRPMAAVSPQPHTLPSGEPESSPPPHPPPILQ
jgi:class 3 adenylate cyclase